MINSDLNKTKPRLTTKTVGIQTALISVSDKTSIVSFAKELSKLGVKLIATGGTFNSLKEAQINVQEVSDYTGFPELIDGRVKTLHPKIYAGILARRGQDDDTLESFQIPFIDLVCVNLYPFSETLDSTDDDLQIIENIDVGGPTLIRAAAKNHAHVGIVTEPSDYRFVIEAIKKGGLTSDLRHYLSCKAFEKIALYDLCIANYLKKKNTGFFAEKDEFFPENFSLTYQKMSDLRYGENPHQKAAWYRPLKFKNGGFSSYKKLAGKKLSYNNISDGHSALEFLKNLSKTACVIIKHSTPCGVSISKSTVDAYKRAYNSDPESAFGGVIAFNEAINQETAEHIINTQFAELIIAPEFEEHAINAFSKNKNIRLIEYNPNQNENHFFNFKKIGNELLVQEFDNVDPMAEEWKLVTQNQPSVSELKDLHFSWEIVKKLRSNAIVVARSETSVGISSGQTSRVFAVRHATSKLTRNQNKTDTPVLASDGFFPFPDNIEIAAKKGISAIVQPGGSINDKKIIAEANKAGIAMIFTGIRHFAH